MIGTCGRGDQLLGWSCLESWTLVRGRKVSVAVLTCIADVWVDEDDVGALSRSALLWLRLRVLLR